jgi:lipopolysaccharide export system permease protein
MKAAGIGEYRIVAPIFLSSALLSILSFTWSELVVPHANSAARDAKKKLVHRVEEKEREVSFYGTGRRFFNIKEIDLKKKHLYGVQVLECYQDGLPKLRVDAERGEWKDGRWCLFNGVERRFSRGGEVIRSAKFTKKEIEVGKFEEIRDIIKMRSKPYEMSFTELLRYIKLLKRMGRRARGAMVDLHLKVSFPFTCVVMALLGVPLSLRVPFGWGKLPGFGLSILISFLYWGVIALGRSLGQNNILSPPLSAWLGNIVFLLVGLYMLNKTKKAF